ncbi:MAG: BON domain-containing protein, partial [Candidatus Acidiferrum sp.]
MRKQVGVHLPYVSIVLVGALLSFAAGCKKQANDETIAQDVQAKVAADPDTKDSAVSVTAKDGKVTLRGTVKDQAAQKKVEQIAHDEPGATGVSDETAVVSAGAAAGAVADQAAP